jgi:hypothetical protein
MDEKFLTIILQSFAHIKGQQALAIQSIFLLFLLKHDQGASTINVFAAVIYAIT